MTRDEALDVVRKALNTSNPSTGIVNALVGLGLLKLEEPPSARERAAEALALTEDFHLKTAERLITTIEAAGFKIVEADK